MSPQNSEWNDMLDEMQHDKEANTSLRKYWQPPSDKEGTFPIRILPPLKSKGEKKFYFEHKIHWIDRVPYECLNQDLIDKNGNLHKAEECPICNYVRKLYKISEKKSDGWILANDLRAKTRYDYRIIIRNTAELPSDETKPVFFETGSTIWEMLYHIMKETDFGIIIDPKNGRDFNIVKKGLKRQSRYEQSLPSTQVTPIFTDSVKIKAMLENALKMDYSSLVEFVSSEDIDKALRAYIGGEEKPITRPRATESTTDESFSDDATEDSSLPSGSKDTKLEDDAIDEILKEFT